MNYTQYEEIAVISDHYKDLMIDGQILSSLSVGTNGIYVCVEPTDEPCDVKGMYELIKKKLHLRDGQLFLFFVSDDTDDGIFYDYISGAVKLENVCEAYSNCYYNHLIPQADLFHLAFHAPADYCKEIMYETDTVAYDPDADQYVAPVVSIRQMEMIKDLLDQASLAPVCDGRYRIYPDGSMEIKKMTTETIGGIVPTFVEKEAVYFPCMDMDGDQFFLLTLLGGWFGLHKYKTGNYLHGLMYTLTFGCCGVFYVLDLLAILAGTYNYTTVIRDKSGGVAEYQKKRFYSRPLKFKKGALLLTLVGTVAAYFLTKYVYTGILTTVIDSLSVFLSNADFVKSAVGIQ